MIYRKGRYLPGKKLRTPSAHGVEFILYGLTLADINGDGKDEVVMLDKDTHLRVYNTKGRVLVQSSEYYGRDPRFIEVGVREDVAGVAQEGEPVQYRGRLSFVRQRSSRYLLLPRIESAGGSLLPGLMVDPNSSVTFLNLTREGFEKSFEVKKQKGYISGHAVMKAQKSSPTRLYMAIVDEKGGLRGKIVSTIYTYFWK